MIEPGADVATAKTSKFEIAAAAFAVFVALALVGLSTTLGPVLLAPPSPDQAYLYALGIIDGMALGEFLGAYTPLL